MNSKHKCKCPMPPCIVPPHTRSEIPINVRCLCGRPDGLIHPCTRGQVEAPLCTTPAFWEPSCAGAYFLAQRTVATKPRKTSISLTTSVAYIEGPAAAARNEACVCRFQHRSVRLSRCHVPWWLMAAVETHDAHGRFEAMHASHISICPARLPPIFLPPCTQPQTHAARDPFHPKEELTRGRPCESAGKVCRHDSNSSSEASQLLAQ